MYDIDWNKHGGEKSEQEIVNLLLQLRRTNWAEYQRIKYVCYLAALSECERQGIKLHEKPPAGKIIKFTAEQSGEKT